MSSSSRRPTLAVVLAASEATWASLWISAFVNTWPHFHMDVPFLALALPAVAMASLSFSVRGRGPMRWTSAVVLPGAGLVVTALCAGLLSQLSVPGSFLAVAFHPWTVTGRTPATISTLSWFFSSLAVGRGTLIGSTRPSMGQSIRSVVVGVTLFLAIFLLVAVSPTSSLDAATRSAQSLFLPYCLAALVLLGLARARTIERTGSAIATDGARRTWVALLASPLVVVAVVGTAAAAGLGSWGSAIGRAFVDAGRPVGRVVGAVVHGVLFAVDEIFTGIGRAIGAVIGLFMQHSVGRADHRHVPHTTTTLAPNNPARPLPHLVTITIEAVCVLGILTALGLLGRHLAHQRPGAVDPGFEERSSVFSARRLVAQLMATVSRLLARLASSLGRRRQVAADPALVELEIDLHPVRREYLRVLTSARAHGEGRRATETAREFGERLATRLGPPHATLADLTTRYEAVRYREAGTTEAEPRLADEVSALISRLWPPAGETPPDRLDAVLEPNGVPVPGADRG